MPNGDIRAELDQILAGVDLHDPNLFEVDDHTFRSPNFLLPRQLPVVRDQQTICVHVWHKTEGHILGDMGRLLSRAAQVSCHGYIPRDVEQTRRIYLVVDLGNEAWQCGVSHKADQLDGSFRKYLGWDNENYRSIGDEIEGAETEEFTAWQIVACLWWQIRLCKAYPNMLPDRDHIIGHYQITRQKSDPQLFPWEVFMNELQNHLGTPDPNPNPAFTLPHFFVETGQSIGGAIGTYWLTHGGLPEFGYPVGPEIRQNIEGQAYTVQYFERARLEWLPGRTADQVTRGRVGAERWEELKTQLLAGSGGH